MITIEDGLYRISPWMRTLLHLTMDAIQVHQSIVHSSDTIPHMAFEWINDAPYVDPIQREVKVQVRVVADGEEQVVLQTNVEMMRCSSVPS